MADVLDVQNGTKPIPDSPERPLVRTPASGWARAWVNGIRPQMDGLLDQLGLSTLTGTIETPPLSKGGAFDIGSGQFRKACAILGDGTVYLVKAYNTAEVAAELAQLRAKFDLPPGEGASRSLIGRS